MISSKRDEFDGFCTLLFPQAVTVRSFGEYLISTHKFEFTSSFYPISIFLLLSTPHIYPIQIRTNVKEKKNVRTKMREKKKKKGIKKKGRDV